MHQMTLERVYPSGAEEWACPICGRRFITTWKPYRRIVLEPGDESASHTGSKGGLKIGEVSVGEEPNLTAFEDWLDGVDLSDL